MRFVSLIICLILIAEPLFAEGLFGTSEIKSSYLNPFPKWQSMLSRYNIESADATEKCTKSSENMGTYRDGTRYCHPIRQKIPN